MRTELTEHKEMKPFRLLVLALAAGASLAASAALPEFKLSDGTSGGRLAWLSHSTDSHAPFKPDAILEITQDDVVSIGLLWSSEPDPGSNECFIASGMWRIPKNSLTAPSYTISAERVSAEEIVFTISETSGVVLLRSSSFRLEKVALCDLKDIGKHIHLLTASEIKTVLGETHAEEHDKPPAHR